MRNKDFIWRVLASDKDRSPIIDKQFETRFGIIWWLLTYWGEYPSRLAIYRIKKPYIATPRKKKDPLECCADDPFVGRLSDVPAVEQKTGAPNE